MHRDVEFFSYSKVRVEDRVTRRQPDVLRSDLAQDDQMIGFDLCSDHRRCQILKCMARERVAEVDARDEPSWIRCGPFPDHWKAPADDGLDDVVLLQRR